MNAAPILESVAPPPASLVRVKRRYRVLRDTLLEIITDFARDHGKAFATERGFREEFNRRVNYRPADRSIGRVLRQLELEGRIKRERVLPGRRLVTGARTTCGGQHNWPIRAIGRKEAREIARQADHKRRARIDAQKREGEKREAEKRAAALYAQLERESPRTRLVVANEIDARSYAMPTFLPPRVDTSSADDYARRVAEVRRQQEMASAHPELWADEAEPPD